MKSNVISMIDLILNFFLVFSITFSNISAKSVIFQKYGIFNEIDWFIVFNATFSNISAISWWPVLVVEEAGVPGDNHRSWSSNW
jgi:hypothetical protein